MGISSCCPCRITNVSRPCTAPSLRSADSEGKLCSFTRPALHTEHAPVQFHDLPSDRQP